MPVPLCDTVAQYEELKSQIDRAVADVMASGKYILGAEVKAFEREVADYFGEGYAVGVNSGTDAIYLALRALGVGPGDEVITTPFTFIATTEAICAAGARPVFVDIESDGFNLDAKKIRAAITSRTKVILPVHLYGHACDMDLIAAIAAESSLFIVEDCAQAMGAKQRGKPLGTIGDAGCLSFFPSKNLGGVGDGGMVITNHASVSERVDLLRRHGGKVKYQHTELGVNSRLDELQAAVLRVKLRHLDTWNARRRAAAERYAALLSHLPIKLPQDALREGIRQGGTTDDGVFHQYTVRVGNRDRVARALSESGIGSAVYYPTPLHLQPVHANLGYAAGDFPNAERAARECLSLPMSPHLTPGDQAQVASVLSAAIDGNTAYAA